MINDKSGLREVWNESFWDKEILGAMKDSTLDEWEKEGKLKVLVGSYLMEVDDSKTASEN